MLLISSLLSLPFPTRPLGCVFLAEEKAELVSTIMADEFGEGTIFSRANWEEFRWARRNRKDPLLHSDCRRAHGFFRFDACATSCLVVVSPLRMFGLFEF